MAALLAALGAGPLAAQRGEGRSGLSVDRPAVLRYDLRWLHPIRTGDNVSVDVPIDGRLRRLNLRPHSVRSDDFRVLVQDGSGGLIDAAAPTASTYRGEVDGDDGTQVIASLTDRGLEARVVLEDGSIWHVGPGRETLRDPSVAADLHAVFRDEDVAREPWGCGAGHQLDPIAATADSWAPVSSVASGGGYKVAEIAFDADVEFFQANGSNVPLTVADIEAVMNGVAAKYEAQFGVTYEITTIVVRTTNDPYTSPNHLTLLSQFQDEWNVNMRHIHRDIAHLMTGRVMQGGVIGSAYIDEMCDVCGTARGYGFSQSRFSQVYSQRVHLTTHELGHSFGACHCDEVCPTNSCYDDCPGDWSTDADCGIMCSSISGCGGDPTVFESRSSAAIIDTAASAACLSVQNAPLDLPFCDTFDGSIDALNWSYNVTGSVVRSNTAPSPPHALLLDGCCAGCSSLPAPDEIRTNRIRLAQVEAASFAYYVRYAGSAGASAGDLVVEYRSSADVWLQLARIETGPGPAAEFQAIAHELPPDALHDDFRVRFRLAQTDSQAAWEIDDVSISTATAGNPVLFVNADAAPGGSGGSWATAYRNLGDALSSAECSLGLVVEIWVAAGVYTPDRGTGSRDSTFQMLDGLTLYGGFAGGETAAEQRDPAANHSILSGDIGVSGAVSDNVYHVVSVGASVGAMIDGFTIRSGYANDLPANPRGKGAGVYHSSGAAEFANCRFEENVSGNGGAVHARIGGELRFTDCDFVDNMSVLQGGAVAVESGATVHMDRCRVVQNEAGVYGGAVSVSGSALQLRNSLLVGNHSSYQGGAMYVSGASASVANCTLYRNTATYDGGGIFSGSSGVDILSSILWQNLDQSGSLESSQLAGAFFNPGYSIVQGWTGGLGGDGNSGSDPVFADPNGLDGIPGSEDDDLRPIDGSAALDAGDPTVDPIPGEVDIAGRPRVLCTQIDVGAYEAGWGDFDCDGVVELSDGAGWAECLTGPEPSSIASSCLGLDLDGSGTVDMVDFSLWTGLISESPP
jgi:predicted Zn-dependent protease